MEKNVNSDVMDTDKSKDLVLVHVWILPLCLLLLYPLLHHLFGIFLGRGESSGFRKSSQQCLDQTNVIMSTQTILKLKFAFQIRH